RSRLGLLGQWLAGPRVEQRPDYSAVDVATRPGPALRVGHGACRSQRSTTSRGAPQRKLRTADQRLWASVQPSSIGGLLFRVYARAHAPAAVRVNGLTRNPARSVRYQECDQFGRICGLAPAPLQWHVRRNELPRRAIRVAGVVRAWVHAVDRRPNGGEGRGERRGDTLQRRLRDG